MEQLVKVRDFFQGAGNKCAGHCGFKVSHSYSSCAWFHKPAGLDAQHKRLSVGVTTYGVLKAGQGWNQVC